MTAGPKYVSISVSYRLFRETVLKMRITPTCFGCYSRVESHTLFFGCHPQFENHTLSFSGCHSQFENLTHRFLGAVLNLRMVSPSFRLESHVENHRTTPTSFPVPFSISDSHPFVACPFCTLRQILEFSFMCHIACHVRVLPQRFRMIYKDVTVLFDITNALLLNHFHCFLGYFLHLQPYSQDVF